MKSLRSSRRIGCNIELLYKTLTSQLNFIFPEVATPNLQEVMKYDLALDTDKLVLT